MQWPTGQRNIASHMHTLFAIVHARGRRRGIGRRGGGRERRRGGGGGRGEAGGSEPGGRINRYRDTASMRKPTGQQLSEGASRRGAGGRRLECTENRSQGCRHSEICNGTGTRNAERARSLRVSSFCETNASVSEVKIDIR